MTRYVTLKRDALKTIVKDALWKAFAAKVGNATINHTNHDAYYTPAQWWFDNDKTIRHTMSTSGSLSFSDGKFTINLEYNVTTL